MNDVLTSITYYTNGRNSDLNFGYDKLGQNQNKWCLQSMKSFGCVYFFKKCSVFLTMVSLKRLLVWFVHNLFLTYEGEMTLVSMIWIPLCLSNRSCVDLKYYYYRRGLNLFPVSTALFNSFILSVSRYYNLRIKK